MDSIFSTLISPCSRKTACIPGSVRMQPTQITVSCKPPGSRFIRSVIMVFQRFRRCLHLSGRNLQGYRGVAASNVERKLGKTRVLGCTPSDWHSWESQPPPRSVMKWEPECEKALLSILSNLQEFLREAPKGDNTIRALSSWTSLVQPCTLQRRKRGPLSSGGAK